MCLRFILFDFAEKYQDSGLNLCHHAFVSTENAHLRIKFHTTEHHKLDQAYQNI